MDRITLTRAVPQTRVVKVYGIEVTIPRHAKYVAVDHLGLGWAFVRHPVLDTAGYWDYVDEYPNAIGIFSLNGADWRKTLRYVGD